MIGKLKSLFFKKKKFTPKVPRKFVIIRWHDVPKTKEDLEIFSSKRKVVEVYFSNDFRRPILYDVHEYLPGIEAIYEDQGFYVIDLTTGIRTSRVLLDTAVSWDLEYIRV